MKNKLRLTAHVWKRLAQRNITLTDLLTAIDLGQKIHRAHACFYFLGFRNLPADAGPEMDRLVGTTVVVENDHIVTAYRSKWAAARIKRKAKRYHGDRGNESRAASQGARVATA